MDRFESLQPGEERQFEFDFSNKLGTATVASATTTGKIVSTGVDVSATLLTAAKQSISGQSVYIWVVGLVSGIDYQITCVATASDGQKVELEGLVLCSSVPAAAGTAGTGPGRVIDPVIEPVSLAEAKLHLRVDGDADDELISSLVIVAREHVEDMTGRALLTQTWDYCLQAFPADKDYIKLPYGKLQSVTSVKWKDSDGTETTMVENTDYIVGLAGDQCGRVFLPDGISWPTDSLYPYNPITVRFVCGWTTAASVPNKIRAAIKMIIADLYSQRGDAVIGQTVVENKAAERLLSSCRLWDEF
jgi:uncharacterized phiE125 gp8 family phage protein